MAWCSCVVLTFRNIYKILILTIPVRHATKRKMNNASIPLALPRRKTPMPLQGMRKNIRKTHGPNRQVNHTEANILRVSILHVKTRHNHRKHENHRREADGIPQSVRVTCKMRPLLWAPKRATTRCAVAGRMLALPKSAPMQHPQINALAARKRLYSPYIKG
jgi:hypothetical protein